jgi:hypothetical protein
MDTDLFKQNVLGSDFDAPQDCISISAATNHTKIIQIYGLACQVG